MRKPVVVVIVLLLTMVFLHLSTPTSANSAVPERAESATLNATLYLNPAADAFVTLQHPTRNYGSSAELQIDGGPFVVKSYLQFNVTGVSGTVASATLLLYAESSLSAGYNLYSVSNNAWSENTITYANAPAMGSLIGSASAVTAGTWTSVDVTRYVIGNGPISFGVADPTRTALTFASRESANKPQLLISMSNTPSIATATPTQPLAIPPTATRTATAAPVPPTATRTATASPIPPTPTRTPTAVPVPPTATPTPLSSSTGKVYYVATNGNDANAGTLAAPWRTIQKAADTLAGGDTVYIRGGSYNERVSVWYRDNTSGPFITFTAIPGETVTLDGTGIDIQHGEGLFHIQRTNFVRVTGLTVQHSNGAGIEVFSANNVRIENNRTYDTVKSGIGVWGGTNVLVNNNDVGLACNPHTGYASSEEPISIASGATNVEVKNNYVHDDPVTDYPGGEGINIKDGASFVTVHHNRVERMTGYGFGVDGWSHYTHDIQFYDNISANNQDGYIVESEAGGPVANIFVYNNIAINNTYMGLYMPTWGNGGTALKQNVQFINNTVYGSGLDGVNIMSANVAGVIVRNNILYQNGNTVSIDPGAQAQVTLDHNLTVDPRFVNAAGGDFHLQAGSPAIDAGSSLNAPNTDFDGNPRPRGAGYDIGAHEY